MLVVVWRHRDRRPRAALPSAAPDGRRPPSCAGRRSRGAALPVLAKVVVTAAGTLVCVHVRFAKGAVQGCSTEVRAGQSRTQPRREGLEDADAFSHGRAVFAAAASLWSLVVAGDAEEREESK